MEVSDLFFVLGYLRKTVASLKYVENYGNSLLSIAKRQKALKILKLFLKLLNLCLFIVACPECFKQNIYTFKQAAQFGGVVSETRRIRNAMDN